jgi:CTD small phosphatase-like protein 2
MVLVDNAPYSYIFQLENGIPILPYYKGMDSQLPQLEKYLEELVNVKDVREVNKKRFRLH